MSSKKTLKTSELINSITLRASIPITQVTFQEPEMLVFINEEIDLGVVPHIMSYHEDYFLVQDEIKLENGVDKYQIPSRAVGNKLRDITFFDGGNRYEMTRVNIEDLVDRNSSFMPTTLRQFYIEGDEIVISPNLASTGNSLLVSYYLRPNTIVSENDVCYVTDVNKNNGIVSVDKYPEVFADTEMVDITAGKTPYRLIARELTPDGLVSPSNLTFTFGKSRIVDITFPPLASILTGSYVTVIDKSQKITSTSVFWFDHTGSTPAPIVPGATLYKVNSVSALNTSDILSILESTVNAAYVDNRIIFEKLDASTIRVTNGGIGISVGNNFEVNTTFSTTQNVVQVGEVTIPKKMNKGDVIALPEQTSIPQVPVELHAMLAQRCAMRCLEALNDVSGLQAAALKLNDMELKTGNLIDNRVESSPQKINPRHTPIKRRYTGFRR